VPAAFRMVINFSFFGVTLNLTLSPAFVRALVARLKRTDVKLLEGFPLRALNRVVLRPRYFLAGLAMLLLLYCPPELIGGASTPNAAASPDAPGTANLALLSS